MKRPLLILISLSSILSLPLSAQKLGLKTNALYWGTTTGNISVEPALGIKTTLDIQGTYNPFTFHNNKKLRHWSVQPELRLWLCEKFNGSFFGFHSHYIFYNVGGLNLPFGIFPELKTHRYEGYGLGAGVSYGHQWYLAPHWNLEASFGFGYTYLNYQKYDCVKCGEYFGRDRRHYFGPTKMTLSFVYLFKSKKKGFR